MVSAGVRVELVFHQVVPAGLLALVGPLTLLSKHGLGSRCQMLSFVWFACRLPPASFCTSAALTHAQSWFLPSALHTWLTVEYPFLPLPPLPHRVLDSIASLTGTW